MPYRAGTPIRELRGPGGSAERPSWRADAVLARRSNTHERKRLLAVGLAAAALIAPVAAPVIYADEISANAVVADAIYVRELRRL
jgi:hypothetical protein